MTHQKCFSQLVIGSIPTSAYPGLPLPTRLSSPTLSSISSSNLNVFLMADWVVGE
jgi:hypothetical protein